MNGDETFSGREFGSYCSSTGRIVLIFTCRKYKDDGNSRVENYLHTHTEIYIIRNIVLIGMYKATLLFFHRYWGIPTTCKYRIPIGSRALMVGGPRIAAPTYYFLLYFFLKWL